MSVARWLNKKPDFDSNTKLSETSLPDSTQDKLPMFIEPSSPQKYAQPLNNRVSPVQGEEDSRDCDSLEDQTFASKIMSVAKWLNGKSDYDSESLSDEPT